MPKPGGGVETRSLVKGPRGDREKEDAEDARQCRGKFAPFGTGPAQAGEQVALALAVAVCALLGWVAAGKALGGRLLALVTFSPASGVLEALVGVALLTLAAYVPCIGWLLALLALCWGLGATVLTRFGATRDAFWRPFSATGGAAQHSSPVSGETPPARPATDVASGDTRPLGDGPQE